MSYIRLANNKTLKSWGSVLWNRTPMNVLLSFRLLNVVHAVPSVYCGEHQPGFGEFESVLREGEEQPSGASYHPLRCCLRSGCRHHGQAADLGWAKHPHHCVDNSGANARSWWINISHMLKKANIY